MYDLHQNVYFLFMVVLHSNTEPVKKYKMSSKELKKGLTASIVLHSGKGSMTIKPAGHR